MKTIDKKLEGINYRKRPGAYALVTRPEDELLGIITAENKNFLLGGGIEEGETVLEALNRETIEEIGYTLKNIKEFDNISSYFYKENNGYLNVEAHVFTAEIDKFVCDKIELNHNLIWINPNDYIGKMSTYWQEYLIREFIERKNQDYFQFSKEIADEAGKIMKKYFSRKDISSYKGDKTIVTLADKEINSYLIKRVKETFPNHSVDGEEEQFGESKYVWVCDPVDGTAMYARNIPVSVFSLALVIDGIPTIGIIYDPFTDNLYSAIKGQGAYQNEEKMIVNDYDLGDMKSISNFDMFPESEYNLFPVWQELGKKAYFVGLGSIARACTCVASGEFILAIFPGTNHKNCDIAAAKVIVEEAGGKVTNLFGEEQRYDKSIKGAVISNRKVHNEVINTIKKYLEVK